MLIPLKWLKEYADVACDAHELARKMTFTGSKAESVTELGADIVNVVAGKLLTFTKHPDADKLYVSDVDVGIGSPVQIVTGATNIKAGDTVPIALDQSTLPCGKKIKATKMRGVVSNGMMCSIQELNLTKADYPDACEDGIFVLAQEPESAPVAESLPGYESAPGAESLFGSESAPGAESLPGYESAPTPGTDIRQVLGLDDAVIDFEITTNRPDCLSVLGLAREAAATMGVAFTPPPVIKGGFVSSAGLSGTGTDTGDCAITGTDTGADAAGADTDTGADAAGADTDTDTGTDINDMLGVKIRDTDLCNRYTARVAVGVTVADSPEWMRRKLRNCGVRPINNIVDVTNYVMLELGQPLHAFDIRNISGGEIIVRRAGGGEPIRTLDGDERILDSDMLVIADSDRPIAVAGVMGGEDSEIHADTRAVVIEAANFNGVSVRRTAGKLGMRTEASSRFEKGLDPGMTLAAADRAAELIELIGAGKVLQSYIDVYPNKPEPTRVAFLPDKINALLGTHIGRNEMLRIFEKIELGYDAESNEIVAPTFRMDISMQADLAEEVARFYDYNNIEATLRSGTATTVGMKTPRQKLRQIAVDVIAARGFCEIYTFSFQSPKVYDKLKLPADSSLRGAVRLANPLNEDSSVMRTTALPDMLKTMSDNYHMRVGTAALFEIASTYHPAKRSGAYLSEIFSADKIDVAAADGFLPIQRTELTLGAFGGDNTFFTMKGAVELLLEALGVADYDFERCTDMPYMHPGRTAYIKIGAKHAGYFGELRPDIAEAFSLPEHALAGVLSLDTVFKSSKLERTYKQLPKYPPVPRDLSVVVDEATPAGELIRIIKKQGGAILEGIKVFDVYTGTQVPTGRKSIAFSLLFRSIARTLTDDEVARRMTAIVEALEEEAGAELRVF